MSHPQIEVRDLLLVRAIFSEGTTARAARTLHMTQSGVSHQLRGLEERLQLSVFARRGRGLEITDSGRKILEAGKEILQSVADLELDLRSEEAAPRTLRVATQCYTAYGWLPGATIEMRKRAREVRLRPVTAEIDDLNDAVFRGRVDLALTIAPQKDERLCQRKLFEDELVLLTAVDHRLACREFVTGDDLQEEDLWMLEAARRNGRAVRTALFPRGGGFRSVSLLPLTEAIVEMVRAGLGVSILPAWGIGPSVQRGDIATVRLNERGLRRKWVGVYRRDLEEAETVRMLLAVLREQGPPSGDAVCRPGGSA